ncbi:MAG TPA: SCO family protein [Verrucomicrobiales bacterium]|nr:SCO family protein [Verrucomicrobiales bacterium]
MKRFLQILCIGWVWAAMAEASAEDPPPEAFAALMERRSPDYDYDPPAPGSYALPVIDTAADGKVLSAEGKATRLHELIGDRIVVLSFIYTRCADPKACLQATGVLAELQQFSRSRADMAEEVLFVTLSFDPAFDTPEVMQRYGRVLQEREGGSEWLFLTTRNSEELRPLLKAYGQRVDPRKGQSALGPYYHPLRVYLIDGEKQVRNIYSFGLLDPRLVATDILTLLAESEGAAASAEDGR